VPSIPSPPATTSSSWATLATDAFGYRRLLAFVRSHTTGADRRVWAVEGTCSFAAGLTPTC
jgi:hypothetical protein